MSSLYFRGKIAYARRFANPPPEHDSGGALVITAGYGLVPPGWKIDRGRMRRLQRTRIDPGSRTYRVPLKADLEALSEECVGKTRFVLLGSIATGKYLDVLHPILGDRLMFPSAFVGVGDMQRGSMMLEAARSGIELEYVGMEHVRSTAKAATAR